MTAHELRDHLNALGLNQTEAAKLLNVTARSVRSWAKEEGGTPAPRAAELALRAWVQLHRAGLAWRPDAQAAAVENPAGLDDPDAFARQRALGFDLEACVERVRARRGPVMPWDVNLERGRARLGTMTVDFRLLAGGGFIPQSCWRDDDGADAERDTALVEDACVCIARALARAGTSPLPKFSLSPARLVGEQVLLWDDRPARSVVLVIPRRVIEGLKTFGTSEGPAGDDEACGFANRHRPALAALARRLIEEGAGTVSGLGVRELVLDATALREALVDNGGAPSNGATA